MQKGGWVPLDKDLLRFIPRDRPFSEIEAAFSLSVDYDNENAVTVSGYAGLWGWDRKKVKRFLDKLGVAVEYPENTKKYRNQKGHIAPHKKDISQDIKRTNKEQIRFIDSKWIADKRDINGANEGHKSGHKKDINLPTTLNPKSSNLNPESKNNPPNPPLQKAKMLTEETLRADTPELAAALHDCKELLGLSETEIVKVFSNHSEIERFQEAVQVAVEKTERDGHLYSPVGFIIQVYKDNATSLRTRRKMATRNEEAVEEEEDYGEYFAQFSEGGEYKPISKEA